MFLVLSHLGPYANLVTSDANVVTEPTTGTVMSISPLQNE
jgi:hypothetical protein